jgi:hypothetical protein
VPQQSHISFPMGTKNVLIIDGSEAIQVSGSVSWLDPQLTCRPPAPTKS